MLVFKDSIMGLVSGIQLTANDMLHVGDWISMSKYGVNGRVTEVTLNTVKVRNWDNTSSSPAAGRRSTTRSRTGARCRIRADGA